MKKFLAISLLTTLAATSCSSQNQANNVFSKGKAAQEQRAEDLKLKGTWQISSIDYDQHFKIQPFDEGADISCFVGSQWVLVPNNGKGSYSIAGTGNCPSVTENILFSITPDRQFAFKKVPMGEKAKAVTAGYYLQLQNQSQDAFDLVQQVNGDTQMLNVVYHFQRVGN